MDLIELCDKTNQAVNKSKQRQQTQETPENYGIGLRNEQTDEINIKIRELQSRYLLGPPFFSSYYNLL